MHPQFLASPPFAGRADQGKLHVLDPVCAVADSGSATGAGRAAHRSPGSGSDEMEAAYDVRVIGEGEPIDPIVQPVDCP